MKTVNADELQAFVSACAEKYRHHFGIPATDDVDVKVNAYPSTGTVQLTFKHAAEPVKKVSRHI